jgi:hypothetical protein
MAFIVRSRSGRCFPAARVSHSPGTAPPWSYARKFSVPPTLLPAVAGGVVRSHRAEKQAAIPWRYLHTADDVSRDRPGRYDRRLIAPLPRHRRAEGCPSADRVNTQGATEPGSPTTSPLFCQPQDEKAACPARSAGCSRVIPREECSSVSRRCCSRRAMSRCCDGLRSQVRDVRAHVFCLPERPFSKARTVVMLRLLVRVHLTAEGRQGKGVPPRPCPVATVATGCAPLLAQHWPPRSSPGHSTTLPPAIEAGRQSGRTN